MPLTADPLQWSKIDNPVGKPLFFSPHFFPGQDHPKDLFYAWEQNGTLWQVHNDSWQKIIAADYQALGVHYAMTGDSAIVRSVVMPDSRSLVTILRNRKVVYDDTLSSVPLRQLMQVNEQTFIIAGDWGHFYILEKNTPRRVEVPFSRHVTTACRTENGNLWIAVRDDGLYFYDHHSWRYNPLPEGYLVDVNGLFTDSDSLTGFVSNKGVVFAVTENGFRPINTFFSSDYYWYGQEFQNRIIIWGINGFFYDIFHDDWQKIPLSGDNRVNSALILSDSSAVVCLSDGNLLQGKMKHELIFRDLSGYYHLDGNRFESSTDGIIHDFSGNGYKDVLLLNLNESYNLTYFTQIDSMVFSNTTHSSGLDRFTEVTHITAGDITGDGRADLVLLMRPAGKYQLITLANQNDSFVEVHRFALEDTLLQQIEQIMLYDMDDDNILDLLVTGRYAIGSRKSAVVWYKGRRNRVWSKRTVIDSTRYWNKKVRIADLDRDGRDDIFIANLWGEDQVIFDFKYLPEITSLPGYTVTNKAVLADIFPDGYPDIVRIDVRSLSLLKNHGNRTFTEVDITSVFGTVLAGILYDLTVADINGDGLPDLLLSCYPEQNQLWLNNGDGTFSEAAEKVKISNPAVQHFLVEDLDGDGDPDIYGLRPNYNCYWQNLMRGLTPLKIQWHGSGSDYALPPLTAHFRTQEGDTFTVWSDLSHARAANRAILPPGTFKLQIGNQRSVTLSARSGKEMSFSAEPTWLMSIRKACFRGLYYLHQPRIWVLAGMFLVMLGFFNIAQKLGMKILHLSWQMRQGLMIANISLFWILMVTISHPRPIIQYGLPALVLIALNSLPFITVIPIIRHHRHQDLPSRRQALLHEVMVFSHGEWAMSNLNGLILLLKNYPLDEIPDNRYQESLREKINVFIKLTSAKIAELVRLGNQTGIASETFGRIQSIELLLRNNLQAYARIGSVIDRMVALETARMLEILKVLISEIKQATFDCFSCDARQVIQNLLAERQARQAYSQIRQHFHLPDGKTNKVLITAPELADILDILLQNAEKAMQSQSVKELAIDLQNVGHRCRITVADSGENIPPDQRQKIFSMAYSTWGGSGKGLPMSAKIAETYGGRLFLSDQSPLGGAAFVLELNLV